MLQDDRGDTNAGLLARAQDAVQWGLVHRAYARYYAQAFAHEFTLPSLQFESLQSPREYNFSTDRIFCEISADDVDKMLDTVLLVDLVAMVRELFTSRDGFISFYSPDLKEWGLSSTWDHNQVGALLLVYVEHISGESWGSSNQEYDLMESAQCNGYFEEWLSDSNPTEFARLWRVADYLRARAARG
jgi:hypothetical protein